MKTLVKPFIVICLACCLQPVRVHAQISQVMGIDTTQSLGNFDYVFGTVAQPNGTVWLGGRCERTQTTSGGLVNNYGTLVQMTSTGNIITSKKSGFRSVNSIALADDGNLVIGGEGSGFFCTSGMCKSDMLVAKISTNNTLVWGRSYGNPNYNGSDGFKRVIETADSNIVAVGNIYESSMNSHPFIAKIDGTTGDSIWSRAFGYPSNQFGNDASEGPNGELFMGISGDLRVIKLTAAGMVEWSNGFANYGQVMRVFAQSDGSVIAAGHYMTAAGDYNACLFKVSATGTLVWFRDYNTQLPDHFEMLNDVKYVNGSFYLAGFHYSNVNFTGYHPLVFKTDSLGNPGWSIALSTVGETKSLMQQGANLLCGFEYSPPVLNNRPDILLLQVDMNNGSGNSCMVSHPITMANPTITTFTVVPWYYTDFETQVTAVGISNQNYWRTPTCLTTGFEDAQPTNAFNITQQDGQLSVTPFELDKYSIEVTDVTGKRLHYRENISGNQVFDLNRIPNQLLLIRIISGNTFYTEKILAQ